MLKKFIEFIRRKHVERKLYKETNSRLMAISKLKSFYEKMKRK